MVRGNTIKQMFPLIKLAKKLKAHLDPDQLKGAFVSIN